MYFLSLIFSSTVYAVFINSYYQFTRVNFAQESQVTFGTFSVPGGKSLDIRFKNGATVKFTGKITFQKGSWGKKNYFVYFRGDNLKISGGLFDGNGQFYWDGKGMHSNKPHFFSIETTNSYYYGMRLINAPVFMIQVHNDGNTFDGLVLEAGGSKPQTKNTDGFGKKILTTDISANNIVIKNTIVTNQDDCVAINRGTNIVLENMKCVNGHGISIGSIRQGAIVDGVKVTNCQVYNSQQGFRIKGWFNDKGTVKNVLVNGLKMQGITKGGVVIVQDYAGGPQMGKFASGFNIQYSNIKLMNVVGSVMPKAKTQIIMCAKNHCNNMDLGGVRISGNGPAMRTDVSRPSQRPPAQQSPPKKDNNPPKKNNPQSSTAKQNKGTGNSRSVANPPKQNSNSGVISVRVNSVFCSSRDELVISFGVVLPSDSKLSTRAISFTLSDKLLSPKRFDNQPYGMLNPRVYGTTVQFTEIKYQHNVGGNIVLNRGCSHSKLPSTKSIKILVR